MSGFIVGYCYSHTSLLSTAQPYDLARCMSSTNDHKFFSLNYTYLTVGTIR